MAIPQLKIDQTFAQIGIRTTRPIQEIYQPKAELNIRQIPAKMIIHREKPFVYIDQSQAWEELGLKSILKANQEYAAKGRQAALEGIAKIAREGIMLRSIENGGEAGVRLKQISKERFQTHFRPSQLTFKPSVGSVKMQGDPGKLTIQWKIGGVEMDPVVHPKAIHNYTPGKAETYLARKNSIRIWVEPSVDTRL